MSKSLAASGADVTSTVENKTVITDDAAPTKHELSQVLRELKALKSPESGITRPLMPFMRFSNKMFDVVRHSNPSSKIPEIGRIMGQQWRNLDAAEKQLYIDEYEMEKEPYLMALHGYQCTERFQDYLQQKEKLECRRRQLELQLQHLGSSSSCDSSIHDTLDYKDDHVTVSSVAMSPQSLESKPEMPLRSSQSLLPGGYVVSANNIRQQVSNKHYDGFPVQYLTNPMQPYRGQCELPSAGQPPHFPPQGMPFGMMSTRPSGFYTPLRPDSNSHQLRNNPLASISSVERREEIDQRITVAEGDTSFSRYIPDPSNRSYLGYSVAAGGNMTSSYYADNLAGAGVRYRHPNLYRPQMPFIYHQHLHATAPHANPPGCAVNLSGLATNTNATLLSLQQPRLVDAYAEQKLASARLRINQALMYEIFSKVPVPDATIVSQARVDLLRQQIAHLEKHRELLAKEVDELDRQYETKNAAASGKRCKVSHYVSVDGASDALFDDDDELLPKSMPDPITAKKFTEMVDKAYTDMIVADQARQAAAQLHAVRQSVASLGAVSSGAVPVVEPEKRN